MNVSNWLVVIAFKGQIHALNKLQNQDTHNMAIHIMAMVTSVTHVVLQGDYRVE